MSFEWIHKPLGSMRFRLAAISALIIGGGVTACFLLIYSLVAKDLDRHASEAIFDDLLELTEAYEEGGIKRLGKQIDIEERAHGKNDRFFRVIDARGQEIVSSDTSQFDDAVIRPARLSISIEDGSYLDTVVDSASGYEVRRLLLRLEGGPLLVLGATLREKKEFLSLILSRFASLLALLVAISAAGAGLIAHNAMSGVDAVSRAALSIQNGNLDKRVTLKVKSIEIQRLVTAFNQMVDKLDTIIRETKQVNENIAHELRTPITRIRGNAELATMNCNGPSDQRDLLGIIVEECDDLLMMVNAMLDISELESQIAQPELAPVDLKQLILDICELFLPLAEEKGVALCAETHGTAMAAVNDKLLHQALANVVDNAIKYSTDGGHVTLTLSQGADDVQIQVADDGVGIPEDEIEHVFERFYRGKRSHSSNGSGLGLGLVAAILKAHQGHVDIQSKPGIGTTVTLTLSTAPSASSDTKRASKTARSPRL